MHTQICTCNTLTAHMHVCTSCTHAYLITRCLFPEPEAPAATPQVWQHNTTQRSPFLAVRGAVAGHATMRDKASVILGTRRHKKNDPLGPAAGHPPGVLLAGGASGSSWSMAWDKAQRETTQAVRPSWLEPLAGRWLASRSYRGSKRACAIFACRAGEVGEESNEMWLEPFSFFPSF